MNEFNYYVDTVKPDGSRETIAGFIWLHTSVFVCQNLGQQYHLVREANGLVLFPPEQADGDGGL